MNRALDRIEITGFKSISKMDLELRPLNVLIGPNGAGKSNFVGVFKLLNRLVEGRLQDFVARSGGADSLLHFGRKRTQKVAIDLAFGERKNGYTCALAPTAEDNLFFESESCRYHNKNDYPAPDSYWLGSGHKETRLLEIASEGGSIARHVKEAVLTWKIYHFHDTSESSVLKQTGDLEDNLVLRPDASNLAAFLYRLKETNEPYYSNISRTIRLVAPFFDSFHLTPSRLAPDKIRLEWREKNSDGYFNASALSDGTLRFICLATLLLQPTLPSTIFLDEPELGLHPYAMTVLSQLLRTASQQTQVVLSTQSVNLVNQFEPVDIVVVERREGTSVFGRLGESDMKEWLDEYGLGDLWEKNLIGGRPR